MPKLIDLTGRTFGQLKVLYRGINRERCAVWICQCECCPEEKIPVRGAALRSGQTKSCGCLRAEKGRNRGLDLAGKVIGRWKVLEQAPNRGRRRYWLCECDCEKATRKEVSAASLLSGMSQSCGCALRRFAWPEQMPLAA